MTNMLKIVKEHTFTDFVSKHEKEILDFDMIAEYSLEEDDYDLADSKMYAMEVSRSIKMFHELAEKGATNEELIKAAKYVYVVLNSTVCKLDFCKAFKDFGIRKLTEKYGLYNKRAQTKKKEIDYKKSFEKLVDQIKFEYECAGDPGENRYFDMGMRFAYGSIKELAEKLEKGEFNFE